MGAPWQGWYREHEIVEPEVSRLEELFRLNDVRRILDFGCGMGRHTVYLARKGFEMYGFDRSREAVDKVQSMLTGENLSARLMVWNMLDPLPYETGFFDAVLAVRVIQHTYRKDIENILQEIDRVMRDRGFLFMQVVSFERRIKNMPEEGKTSWVEPGTAIAHWGDEIGVPHHYFTEKELRTLLGGYEILEIHSETDHYPYGYCVIARKLK